ncbi:MAG: phenylacetate-CoA oxygenase/reductase subunit PaaK [Alphaproteobacteria bacterium]|nr:MAG: phenylacetate-CoA oxygenase/reductase subunit PaaK [Alphaproteobacteria bacterium]
MMRKFHPLKVAAVEPAATDAVIVTFEVSDDLREIYRFKPGQHLGLKATIDGEEVRRTYSICTAPDEGRLAIVVRKVPGGRFSTFANEKLAAGDVLEVFPPVGTFTVEVDPHTARHHVAFAAGAGITPVMSILKSVLKGEPKSRFTLFYGNRTIDSMIFRSELNALKNAYLDRFTLHPFFSRQKQEIDFYNGRLDGAKVREILKHLLPVARIDEAWVCGPGTMIDEVQEALAEAGLAGDRIHSERFLTSDEAARTLAETHAREADRAATAAIEVRLDGVEHRVDYEPGSGTILEALEKAGLEVPYSCRGGVCTTCRAKVLEGSAEMGINYGLEEAEVKKGFILTCQAVPTSDKLKLSFDE